MPSASIKRTQYLIAGLAGIAVVIVAVVTTVLLTSGGPPLLSEKLATSTAEPVARPNAKASRATSASRNRESRAKFKKHYGDGFVASLPTGNGWGAPVDSEPTPARLFRSRVDGPGGLFVFVDYTPAEAAMFGGSYSSRQTISGTVWGSATEYVVSGGHFAGCGTCVDYILNDPSASQGFGVLAGGGSLKRVRSLARRVARSVQPD